MPSVATKPVETAAPTTNGGICAAIAAVMRDVHRLKKADNNAFAKYKFTSVDDFKDMVRPLLAANGLALRTDELAFETNEYVADNGKKSLIARYQFAFQLAHVSGESEPVERTTVSLPYTGAQTTGAAKSYALKEFLKGRFLASTGDPDPAEEADTHEQRGYSKTLPKAKGRDVYTRLSGELRMLATRKAFDTWFATAKSDIDSLPEDWQAILRQEAQEKLHELKANGNGTHTHALAESIKETNRKIAALPIEEPDPALRKSRVHQQLADSAFGDGYDKRIQDWEARMKAAKTGDERFDIWAEVELYLEDGGKMFPPDKERLGALVAD